MEIEKIDYRDSVKILAKHANIDLSKYEKDPEAMNKQQEGREKLKLLNKRVQQRFQDHFTPQSSAWAYIKERRKLTDTTIQQFGIGYAPDSHYELVTYLKEKWFSLDDMAQAGVIKKGSSGDAYAFFRDRVTFPILDHIWNIVGFGARALQPQQEPKYLNTTETPLYDKSSILFGLDKAKQHTTEFGMLVIVEWYMDVIALHQYGLPIGIATCGTALTPQHTKLLKRHTDTVIFAFDNDAAGFDATIRWLKIAYQQDLFPKIFQFPYEYKDIDEFLTHSWQQLTKEYLQAHSIDGFTGVVRRLDTLHDKTNPVERKKMLTICFELLSNIEDYTVLVLYLDQLAKLFSTSTDALLNQLKAFLKQQRPSFQPTQETTSSSANDTFILLGWLIYQDFLWSGVLWSWHVQHAEISHMVEILRELVQLIPHTILNEIIALWTLDETTHQQLLEAQLRREQQLTKLTPDKKIHAVSSFLHSQIHMLEKIILKSKTLSNEDKQHIVAKVRALKNK